MGTSSPQEKRSKTNQNRMGVSAGDTQKVRCQTSQTKERRRADVKESNPSATRERKKRGPHHLGKDTKRAKEEEASDPCTVSSVDGPEEMKTATRNWVSAFERSERLGLKKAKSKLGPKPGREFGKGLGIPCQ